MMKRTLFACGMLLLLSLFIFPSSRAFAASPHVVTPAINFSDSCSNLSVDQRGLLKAVCKRRDGSLRNASIGLDAYIGNKDGKLIIHSNHFTESCVSLSLSGATLNADCKAKNGKFVGASIDLDLYIDNTNGALMWVG